MRQPQHKIFAIVSLVFLAFYCLPTLFAQNTASLQILEHRPSDEETGVGVFEEIYIRFSRPVDIDVSSQQLSISPRVAGRFVTDLSGRGVYFKPDERLAFGQVYTIHIKNAVHFEAAEADSEIVNTAKPAFHFRFKTTPRDTAFLQVTDIWPPPDAVGISPTEFFQIAFNRPVDPATLIDNKTIFAISQGGERAAMRFIRSVDGAGEKYGLDPEFPLLPNTKYFVTLLDRVTDFSGVQLRRNFRWTFTTKAENGNWQKIARNPGRPIFMEEGNTGRSKYQVSVAHEDGLFGTQATQVVISGENAATEIVLPFSQSAIPLKSGEAASLAVFGDSSLTNLSFLFSDGRQYFSRLVAIDWTGWRSVVVDTYSDSLFDRFGRPAQLEPDFNWIGVILYKDTGVDQETSLSFDALLVRAERPLFESLEPANAPVEDYFLLRSFPNPMKAQNGSTKISFDLGNDEFVSLAVFDVLGRQVISLVEERLGAGTHTFSWDGLDNTLNQAPAGVYFVRLLARRHHSVLKLSLVP